MGEHELARGDRLLWNGAVATVAAIAAEDSGQYEVVLRTSSGILEAVVPKAEVAAAKRGAITSSGSRSGELAALWAYWMEWARPRIRSAVLATRPLRPFPHQDEAVFEHMLPQPRLRFLLADEPGTGKTIMTGMYLAEGRRQGLIRGRTLIVPPAHLVSKWKRDLRRLFGIDAERITSEMARSSLPLRPDVDVWLLSVDLFAHNADALRTVASRDASWSLVVFDEAHRLTPTSQYLPAAQQLLERAHHALLLTATPHRGKEWYFRSLLNLIDPLVFPAIDQRTAEEGAPLRPGATHFLRRMKEELRDLDGEPLFPPREAHTESVDLDPGEFACYEAVMEYVEQWYGDDALLALSIYGKRAASSVTAAVETLGRRREALSGSQNGRIAAAGPVRLEEDEDWEQAEESIVSARSTSRREELAALDAVLERLRSWQESGASPAKRRRLSELLREHGIEAGTQQQALVFSEYTDTVLWLSGLLAEAGYTTEVLHGEVSQDDRDDLQRRFLDGDFQVLVSTDAGGEGIDLQSAHVLVDWDIPWSLVRLEQRAGRLHRIGQTQTVSIHHLVAPATREGRVQQRMLENLDAAALALDGRLFDLLDAVADRSDFDWGGALRRAQSNHGADLVLAEVPSSETLVARARELVAEEDALKTDFGSEDVESAMDRFARDRVEAINPVMVEGFLRVLADAYGWTLQAGPAPGILRLDAFRSLPEALGGGSAQLVAVDGGALESAREGGAHALEAIMLGPTEEGFEQLCGDAIAAFGQDLWSGGALIDEASLTDYTLFVYAAELEASDGRGRTRRELPVLVRLSGASCFPAAWEGVLNLRSSKEQVTPPRPGEKVDAAIAAAEIAELEAARERETRLRWVERAREDVNALRRRFARQIRHLPDEQRGAARRRFDLDTRTRLATLDDETRVEVTRPDLVGWVRVQGAASPVELGYDPDSERAAISVVLAELEHLGFDVDDRQTAGVGYDLYARHRRTRQQRLVEVKGQLGDLEAVVLESHEWAQAMQRGQEYWLYVVTECAATPAVTIRLSDPAGHLAGPKLIERYRVPVSKLRPYVESQDSSS